ncbi:MAG: esterase [Alphaproteobacteria bacterium]|jgi:pimeloyl-ACP methyl ester carboxylesterase|nr:esterase [Alphaproteobacteria bacterium]
MSERRPAVILVHGFLDSGAIWRSVVETLGAAASDWTMPDLAGMGELCAAEGPFTLHRYADDISALIDRAGGQVVLVGHSMGAQIVELAAARRPKNVVGLLLLSPVPLGGVHAPPQITGPLASTGGNVEAQREARRQLMAQPPDSKMLEWLTGLGRDVKRKVTEDTVAAWNEGVAEGRSPSVFDGPVLVATGDKDAFATAAMSKDIAARFRNASLASVFGVGHWPQAEQPESVAKLILDFVGSVTKKSSAGAKSESGWQQAFGEQNESTFGENFSPEVVFEASVMARRVEGRERVKTILGAASRLYAALEFTHRGTEGSRSFLEWEAKLHGGESVSGITILTSDANGKILSIAIHHRPLSGVLRFSAELRRSLAGKIEPDLFYGGPLVT